MLAKPDVEVVYDPDSGVAVGVRSEGETARAKLVVGDPTYFREKARVAAACVWGGDVGGWVGGGGAVRCGGSVGGRLRVRGVRAYCSAVVQSCSALRPRSRGGRRVVHRLPPPCLPCPPPPLLQRRCARPPAWCVRCVC